jgi:prolipoprotein diacylglyceryltransferase
MKQIGDCDIATRIEYENSLFSCIEEFNKKRYIGKAIQSSGFGIAIGMILGAVYVMFYSWGAINLHGEEYNIFQDKMLEMNKSYRFYGGIIGGLIGMLIGLNSVNKYLHSKGNHFYNTPWKN